MKFVAFVVTEGAMPAEAIAEMNRDWPAYAAEMKRRGGLGSGGAEPSGGDGRGDHCDPDLGTGSKTEIILGAYAGLWPMLMNTAGGARSIPPALLDVARMLRLSRMATVRKIIMPSTAAAMLVGARLALATTLVICVVAEILGLQSDVGNQLVLEESGFQSARTWAYILVIGVLGILLNFLLVRLVRVLFPGVSAASERGLA